MYAYKINFKKYRIDSYYMSETVNRISILQISLLSGNSIKDKSIFPLRNKFWYISLQ